MSMSHHDFNGHLGSAPIGPHGSIICQVGPTAAAPCRRSLLLVSSYLILAQHSFNIIIMSNSVSFDAAVLTKDHATLPKTPHPNKKHRTDAAEAMLMMDRVYGHGNEFVVSTAWD